MSSHSSGPSGPLEPGRAHFRKAGHGEIVSYIEHNGQRFKVTFTPPEDTADKRYIHLPDAAKKIQAIAQSILQKASTPETLKTHTYQADILFQESEEEITGVDIDVSKKDKSKSDAKYEKMELEAEHVREITSHAMELITFVNPRHMTRLGSPAASPRSSARPSRRSSLSTAESGAHAAGGLGLGGAARSRRGSDASTGSSRSTSRRSSLSEGPRGGGAAEEAGGSRLLAEAFHRRGGSGSAASSRRDSFAGGEASLLGSALEASGTRAHAVGGGEEHAVEIPKVERSSIETTEYEGKVYYKSDLDAAQASYQAACEAVGGGSIGETEQAFVTRTLESNVLEFQTMVQDPAFLSLCPPVILNAQHNCFLNAELISLLNNNETCSYLIGALDSLKSNTSNPTIEGTDTEQKNLDYINSLNIKEDYKEIFCQLTIGQSAVNADNIIQKYLGGDDLDEIESQLLRMCLIKLFNKKPREMGGSLKLPHVDEGCEMQLSWANQEDPSEFLRLLQEGLTSLEIDPPNPEILQILYLEDDHIQTDGGKIQLTREFSKQLEGSKTGTIVLNYEGDKIWALNKIEGYEISSLVVKQGGSHYISVLTINDQDNVPHFIVYDDYKEPPKYEISSLEYFELICGLDHNRKIKSATLVKVEEEEIPPMPKRPPPAPPKYPPLPRSPEGSQASSRRGSDASAEE